MTSRISASTQCPGVISGSDAEASTGGIEYIDPQRICWAALRTLLKTVVYGGRLDNEVDELCLSSFVDALFCPDAFESDFCLSTATDATPLRSPDLFRTFELYQVGETFFAAFSFGREREQFCARRPLSIFYPAGERVAAECLKFSSV